MDSVCLNGWAGQGKSSRKQSQIPARIRSYIENLCLDVVTAYLFIYIYVWFLRISRSWPVPISGTRGKIVVYSWSLADSFTHSFSSTTFIVFTHCASAVHIKVKATLFCHFPQRHLRQWQKQIDGSTWWGSLRKTQTEQLQRSLGSSASGIWWTTNLGPGESWRLLDKKKDLSVYTGMFYT